VAFFPAVTVVPEGVAVREKSAKKTDNETALLPPPVLVPVTVKFRGFAVFELRLVRVRVLDPPAEIPCGLNVHVTPEPQDKLMAPWNVLGPEAVMVKVAFGEPMRTTLDRALEESEKRGLPVPVTLSPVAVFTAFEVTVMVPVTLPVLLGVKLTPTVQLWPTFKVAGMVGKLGPQLLVSAKPAVAAMLVMVTA